MKYKRVTEGRFISRPNRFIAYVEIDGATETVHVKNTGRCRELLVPGAQVLLEESDNPARKYKYSLVTVKKGSRLVNMDSQAPNIAAKEWLLAGGLGTLQDVRAETKHGDSRFERTGIRLAEIGDNLGPGKTVHSDRAHHRGKRSDESFSRYGLHDSTTSSLCILPLSHRRDRIIL